MFTLLLWFFIGLASVYLSVWLVTRRKPDDWNGMMVMALLIPFFESLRYWPFLVLPITRPLVIGLRLAAAVISVVMLYVYAHLRLGLESEWRKWAVATLYPGVKFFLFLLFGKYPR